MKTVLFTLFLFTELLFGQTKAILKPSGELKYDQEIHSLNTKISPNKFKPVQPYAQVRGLCGSVDTLRWAQELDWDTNFGFFGQDVMVQWFIAPADMYILGLSFTSSDATGPNVSVKLVEINWSLEQLKESGTTNWGYYEAQGNGFNDIEPFIDNDHGFEVGEWIDVEGDDRGSPFGSDIWSDEGFGIPVYVDLDSAASYWVSTDILDFNPALTEGTVFGVVVKNESPVLGEDRHALLATKSGSGLPGFKFHNNGRFFTTPDQPDSNSLGWWTHEQSWDMEVEILIPDGRAPAPITIINPSYALLDQPYTVYAQYHYYPPRDDGFPISIFLNYMTESDTAWTSVLMDSVGNWIYKKELPVFPLGENITYYCETRHAIWPCTDTRSPTFLLHIYEPIYPTLLVFNGYGATNGYPQSYYFGIDDSTFDVLQFDHDRWSYGPLVKQLVDNYDNILEFTTTGPNDINDAVIREWLESSPSHNYMLVGDEYLGFHSSWPDKPVDYIPGTFQNDILGIEVGHKDIVSGSAEITPVRPIIGSLLGDALYKRAIDLEIHIDSIFYDPNFEIGVPNWLDGVEISDDSESFMETDSGNTVMSIGHSRVLPAGNKIVFFAYDPLSINSRPYRWLSFDESSPQVQALKWFTGGHIWTDVKSDLHETDKFSLSQNYPNPFNHETIINYELGITNFVKLVVFDALGREIKELVNKKQGAGKFRVTFDAGSLASGIYYYRLTMRSSGAILNSFQDLSLIRKMLLLK